MAGLPDLVVGLAANTGKFERGMAKAQTTVTTFASVTKTAMAAVKVAMVGATAGLAAIAGAAYTATGRINALDKIAKDAAKTGLSGAFLQRLEFAADQSGVSSETLTAAIKKLTIAAGSGSKAFGELGLNLDSLRAMSPEQQFLAVAEKISAIPTAAGRASAAVKVFGKSGIEMTTLFGGGLKGINDLMAKAQALGIGISPEGLAKAEAANDAIGQMKAAFTALLDQLTVGVAPVFVSITNSITEWIPPLTKFLDGFNQLDNKLEFAGQLFDAAMADAFDTIASRWESMLDGMVDYAASVGPDIADAITFGALSGLGVVEGGKLGVGKMDSNAKPGGGGRLADLLSQLDAPDWQGPKVENAGPKAAAGTGNIAGLGKSLAETWGPLAGGIQTAVQTKIGEVVGDAKFLGGLAKSAFTGDAISPQKQIGPQFAGAMAGGSAAAYSNLVQAMGNKGKDPVVVATEKQTKDLIKGLKPAPAAIKVVGDLMAGVFG